MVCIGQKARLAGAWTSGQDTILGLGPPGLGPALIGLEQNAGPGSQRWPGSCLPLPYAPVGRVPPA